MLLQLFYCLITVAKKNVLRVVFSVGTLEIGMAWPFTISINHDQSSSALTEASENTVSVGIYDIGDFVMDIPNHTITM